MKALGRFAAFHYSLLLPLAALAAPGDLDMGFNPDVSGLGSFVNTIVTQPDGRLLVGGGFYSAGGYRNIVRLHANGEVDSAFACDANDDVYCIAVQHDGKILIGGSFQNIDRVTRLHVARLNSYGTLDAAFDAGTNNMVTAAALQDDGKILLAGLFGTVQGATRVGLVRLNSDGTLDNGFQWAPTMTVRTMAIQTDGKIVIAGGNGGDVIARLLPDGSRDPDFSASLNAHILCSSIQSDGKVIAGGIGAYPVNFLRFNANGAEDFSFPWNQGGYELQCIATQTDGNILVGGTFTTLLGVARARIARLDSHGIVELPFKPNPGGSWPVVHTVSVQANGGILFGGQFDTVGGVTRNGIARLYNSPATQSLTVPGSGSIQWLRGGTSPETQQVRFDVSNDGGANWLFLGPGTRIAGGWERTGATLPSSGVVRARARTYSGNWNGSSGLVETTTPFAFSPPLAVWKLRQLGNPDAPDDADPEGDGLSTLIEYALILLPAAPSLAPPAERHVYAEGDRLRIFVPRDPAHNDIIVSVEATGDLATTSWSTLATSIFGAPFIGPGYVGGDDTTPGVKRVEVRDVVNSTDAAQRFLRIKITH
jgi:uncharacterized delta-60 repeat protein